MERISNGGKPLKDCPVDWAEANNWEEEANKGLPTAFPKWSWDRGFKLDYDGPLGLELSSRFYPKKKATTTKIGRVKS